MKGGLRPRQVMRHRHRSDGFTIVETLIVLAVSGGMLLGAILLINGRQGKTQFTQSIQNVQSQIRQSINDVQSGYYPSNSDFRCIRRMTFPPRIIGGAAEQGTNEGCVFLGKVMRFGSGLTGGNTPNMFDLYSVAANRSDCNAVATELECLSDYAHPTLVWSGNTLYAYDTKHLLYGLSVQRIEYGSPAQQIGAFGLLASQGAGATASGDGSQQVNLVALRGTGLTQSQQAGVTSINNALRGLGTPQSATPQAFNPPGGIRICFVSGSSNQSGLITIGAGSRQTTVDLSIRGNTTCS